MAFLIHEHFKKDLRQIFGMTEDDMGDIADEIEATPADAPADGAETTPEADPAANPAADPAADAEAPADGADNPLATAVDDLGSDEAGPSADDVGADGAAPEQPESEIVPGTGDEVASTGETDESKVSSMFNDMGKPETDYSFSNPNNIRLAKFRFKKSGIDINQMMNEIEQKIGLTVDKLIYRLTPEQYESYKQRGKEIRRKFELIEKREKNIIFFNSRIPIYFHDKNTNEVKKIGENDPNMLKGAYAKIDEFVTKRFGDDWVDDLDAIDFIQSIKVNFAAKESITPNMITTKFFEGDDEKIMPFNKLYVKMPKAVEDFVRENKDNQNYLRSAVFRTLATGYVEGATDSNGVFAILKGDAPEEGAEGDVGAEGDPLATGDNPDAEGDAALADIGDTPTDPGAAPDAEAPPEEPVAPPEEPV